MLGMGFTFLIFANEKTRVRIYLCLSSLGVNMRSNVTMQHTVFQWTESANPEGSHFVFRPVLSFRMNMRNLSFVFVYMV
jgi:hypothetical protein